MTLIKCNKCKKQISSAAVACVHCGEPNEMKLICPECNKENNISNTICNNCGYPLKQESQFSKSANKAIKAFGSAMKTLADELDQIVTKK